jgi:hypothetical protein
VRQHKTLDTIQQIEFSKPQKSSFHEESTIGRNINILVGMRIFHDMSDVSWSQRKNFLSIYNVTVVFIIFHEKEPAEYIEGINLDGEKGYYFGR